MNTPAGQDYVLKINATWQKATASIIETGRLLIEAKEALPHGEWLSMFSSKLIPSQVPFGERTAQMLMTIARNPVLGNPKFVSVLPPSWGTLVSSMQVD